MIRLILIVLPTASLYRFHLVCWFFFVAMSNYPMASSRQCHLHRYNYVTICNPVDFSLWIEVNVAIAVRTCQLLHLFFFSWIFFYLNLKLKSVEMFAWIHLIWFPTARSRFIFRHGRITTGTSVLVCIGFVFSCGKFTKLSNYLHL